MLEDKRYQPAVLQCLGCIAQIAMPVYETRESEVVEFIRSKILKLKSVCISNVLYFAKSHYLSLISQISFHFYWKSINLFAGNCG